MRAGQVHYTVDPARVDPKLSPNVGVDEIQLAVDPRSRETHTVPLNLVPQLRVGQYTDNELRPDPPAIVTPASIFVRIEARLAARVAVEIQVSNFVLSDAPRPTLRPCVRHRRASARLWGRRTRRPLPRAPRQSGASASSWLESEKRNVPPVNRTVSLPVNARCATAPAAASSASCARPAPAAASPAPRAARRSARSPSESRLPKMGGLRC